MYQGSYPARCTGCLGQSWLTRLTGRVSKNAFSGSVTCGSALLDRVTPPGGLFTRRRGLTDSCRLSATTPHDPGVMAPRGASPSLVCNSFAIPDRLLAGYALPRTDLRFLTDCSRFPHFPDFLQLPLFLATSAGMASNQGGTRKVAKRWVEPGFLPARTG